LDSQALGQNATALRAIVSTPEAIMGRQEGRFIPVKFIELFGFFHQDRTTTTSSCPAGWGPLLI
jgi:hypothetical protein